MKILQQQIKPAEFIRTVHAARPEPGTTLNDMLSPDYWAHVAKTLKAGDRIEVRPPEGEWFAELYVRSTSDTAVNVVVLQKFEFGTETKSAPVEAEVKFRGDKKWSVIRKGDKSVLIEGLETKSAAEDWLKANQLG